MDTEAFLPSGLITWPKGKMLIKQHFVISILPLLNY